MSLDLIVQTNITFLVSYLVRTSMILIVWQKWLC
jgi:hypothetical protein